MYGSSLLSVIIIVTPVELTVSLTTSILTFSVLLLIPESCVVVFSEDSFDGIISFSVVLLEDEMINSFVPCI